MELPLALLSVTTALEARVPDLFRVVFAALLAARLSGWISRPIAILLDTSLERFVELPLAFLSATTRLQARVSNLFRMVLAAPLTARLPRRVSGPIALLLDARLVRFMELPLALLSATSALKARVPDLLRMVFAALLATWLPGRISRPIARLYAPLERLARLARTLFPSAAAFETQPLHLVGGFLAAILTARLSRGLLHRLTILGHAQRIRVVPFVLTHIRTAAGFQALADDIRPPRLAIVVAGGIAVVAILRALLEGNERPQTTSFRRLARFEAGVQYIAGMPLAALDAGQLVGAFAILEALPTRSARLVGANFDARTPSAAREKDLVGVAFAPCLAGRLLLVHRSALERDGADIHPRHRGRSARQEPEQHGRHKGADDRWEEAADEHELLLGRSDAYLRAWVGRESWIKTAEPGCGYGVSSEIASRADQSRVVRSETAGRGFDTHGHCVHVPDHLYRPRPRAER